MNKQPDVNNKKKSFDFIDFYEPSMKNKSKSVCNEQRPAEIIDTSKANEINFDTNKKRSSRQKNVQKSNNKDTDSPSENTIIPVSKVNKKSGEKVKSIMKSHSVNNESIDQISFDVITTKRKKRNKSVSFNLDDTEETAVKKAKSNDNAFSKSNETFPVKNKIKVKKNKLKKQPSEKENEPSVTSTINVNEQTTEKWKQKNCVLESDPSNNFIEGPIGDVGERKSKKPKKKKDKEQLENTVNKEHQEYSTDTCEEGQVKKFKKKKRKVKVYSETGADDNEPAGKRHKRAVRPDVIAERLENLNIGDNAHTLTDLIDQMTVVNKSKTKGKPKNKNNIQDTVSDNTEVKEKVKWVKKKWNKGRKDFIHEDRIATSVIVENLPLNMILTYKKNLADRFSNCGQIKYIGVAELYPADNPNPVFSTTILFDSEEVAVKALEEDNTLYEGNRIRVRRPLPPTETTIVVRSYAEITEQTLSTMFSGAGRIRMIRTLVKGKKFSFTSFIEFDSPEAVERATKMAEGVKVNGKKVLVFKYEDKYHEKK